MPEEKVYKIPLRDAWKANRNKRAARAAKTIRNFLKRHMADKEIKLDPKLNEKLWSHSIESPPSKIRVKVIEQVDGTILASLAE